MEKIDIKVWEDAKVKTQFMRCMVGINELVEGYNDLEEAYHEEMSVVETRIEEIMERLDKHIKHHNVMDKQDNKDYSVDNDKQNNLIA